MPHVGREVGLEEQSKVALATATSRWIFAGRYLTNFALVGSLFALPRVRPDLVRFVGLAVSLGRILG